MFGVIIGDVIGAHLLNQKPSTQDIGRAMMMEGGGTKKEPRLLLPAKPEKITPVIHSFVNIAVDVLERVKSLLYLEGRKYPSLWSLQGLCRKL